MRWWPRRLTPEEREWWAARRRGGYAGTGVVIEMPKVPSGPASGARAAEPPDRPLSFMDEHDDPALMDTALTPPGWAGGRRFGGGHPEPWHDDPAGPEPTVGPSTPSGASDAYRPPPNRLIVAFAELIAGIDRTVQIGGNMVLNDAIGIPYARVRAELTPDGLWPAASYERVIRQHLGV